LLPKGFRIEVIRQRTELHCPSALGRRLEITRQDEEPGASVQPRLYLALYLPRQKGFIVLMESHKLTVAEIVPELESGRWQSFHWHGGPSVRIAPDGGCR
jgi:hypothetical protein